MQFRAIVSRGKFYISESGSRNAIPRYRIEGEVLHIRAIGLNTFGDGFVYVGAILTATGVFAEVGLPMISFGAAVGEIATFGTHGLDIYYGTFNGQNFMIDVAFWGAGEGFDLITGSEGTYTGYFYIWNEASQEWIKFMNEN